MGASAGYLPPVAAAAAAALLGYTEYSAGADGDTYTLVSQTADTDVDATNLAVAFTAPASGIVVVELVACIYSNGGNGRHDWSLREGASTLANSQQCITYLQNAITRPFYRHRVTGLTPGSAHTYKWAWRQQISSGVIGPSIDTGPLNGPAIMAVWAGV